MPLIEAMRDWELLDELRCHEQSAELFLSIGLDEQALPWITRAARCRVELRLRHLRSQREGSS